MGEFPYSQGGMTDWSNFHGTITGVNVPIYCTPDANESTPSFERQGKTLRAIVDLCVKADRPKPLRVIGSRWSFSDIVKPTEVLVDSRRLNQICELDESFLTQNYLDERYSKHYRPVFVQSGATMQRINNILGQKNLALQTSGASDGQCIGGCIATGTHGAAVGIGAVHDTVLGLHIIVGEDSGSSLFLHRGTDPCFRPGLAQWLEEATTIPTINRPDDMLFRAAQVSLGSLGIVHGVVLEAAPLYKLRQVVELRDTGDESLWNALSDPLTISDDTPYHVQVIINPYKRSQKKDAFLSLMWQKSAGGQQPSAVPLRVPGKATQSDLLAWVGWLSDFVDVGGNLATGVVQRRLDKEIRRNFKIGRHPLRFPGEVFGPWRLSDVRGVGTCTELVVAAADAREAYRVIRKVLIDAANNGKHLLGAIGLRYTKSTDAYLGLNAKEQTCFIDLPSIRNTEVLALYDCIWEQLDAEGVAFTCHWGKLGGFKRARIDRYFGKDRVDKWIKARETLLTTHSERNVFASPLLREAGLFNA